MSAGPFNLDRFVQAQAKDYARALSELRAGRKTTHWMWYVLPQLRGLGSSSMATYYGIGSLDEARAYLAHPVSRAAPARMRRSNERASQHERNRGAGPRRCREVQIVPHAVPRGRA